MEKTLYADYDCYAKLMSILDEIQEEASKGVLEKNARDCCLEIGAHVIRAKQVVVDGMSFGPDSPTAA